MSNVAKKVPNTKGEFEMYCRDFKQIEQKKKYLKNMEYMELMIIEPIFTYWF